MTYISFIVRKKKRKSKIRIRHTRERVVARLLSIPSSRESPSLSLSVTVILSVRHSCNKRMRIRKTSDKWRGKWNHDRTLILDMLFFVIWHNFQDIHFDQLTFLDISVMVFVFGLTSECSEAKQAWFPPKILEAQLGRPHSVVINLWVLSTPDSTFRSTTSIPTTAGFIGLGYFLQAADTTVSQGWLQEKHVLSLHLFVTLLPFLILT